MHDAFRQVDRAEPYGKIHALQISTESSIRAAQERSKKSDDRTAERDRLREIDEQTEILIASLGDTQVDTAFSSVLSWS